MSEVDGGGGAIGCIPLGSVTLAVVDLFGGFAVAVCIESSSRAGATSVLGKIFGVSVKCQWHFQVTTSYTRTLTWPN